MAISAARIAVLGATGSVGTQALAVCEALGLPVTAVAARDLSSKLVNVIDRHRPRLVAVERAPSPGRVRLPDGCRLLVGHGALRQLAVSTQVDRVVMAVVGLAGLAPTIAALAAGKVVALATKEVVVAGGELVTRAARHGHLLPVDSEHAALFQLLKGARWQDGQTLWITASGGALRDWPMERLAEATKADVLRHPTWTMGEKNTVDSASLMNKGLEVIEAHHLFSAPYPAIQVALQRESHAHAAVAFADGSVVAQLAPPDMRLPIARALAWPAEPPAITPQVPLTELPPIRFEAVPEGRFPALQLAYRAGTMGGVNPALLSSANDAAVSLFLSGRIRFAEIVPLVAATLGDGGHWQAARLNLTNLRAADRWAHRRVGELAGGGMRK